MENQSISPAELTQIRLLDEFDLIMLISEIHDHGWPTAKKLLPIIAESEKVSRAQRPAS